MNDDDLILAISIMLQSDRWHWVFLTLMASLNSVIRCMQTKHWKQWYYL